MKKTALLISAIMILISSLNASAQLVSGKRGSDDFNIGIAGYTYREFSLEQTLEFLKSLDVKYFSVKDWWLPLDSTKEQMFHAEYAGQMFHAEYVGQMFHADHVGQMFHADHVENEGRLFYVSDKEGRDRSDGGSLLYR